MKFIRGATAAPKAKPIPCNPPFLSSGCSGPIKPPTAPPPPLSFDNSAD